MTSVTVDTYMVASDHTEPVNPLQGTAVVKVLTGDTVYYADQAYVTATTNQGSLTVNQSHTFTIPVWLRSASLSSVSVTITGTPDDTQLDAAAVATAETYADVQTAAAVVTAEGASAQALVPTAVKSAPYTATAGDFVPVDISGGSVTVTLPTAPAEKTRIGLKVVKVDGSHANTCTVARGGSDVFNIAAGSTSLTLSALFQGVLLQYKASTGIWYVSTADTPLNTPLGAAKLGTDGTVGGASGSSLTSSVASGALPAPTWLLRAWTLADAYRLVSATRDANEAITTASVVWPDGATGTYTADTLSTAFPGATDAYHVTYVYGSGPTTVTITQPAMTRDASGGVTAQPDLTVV